MELTSSAHSALASISELFETFIPNPLLGCIGVNQRSDGLSFPVLRRLKLILVVLEC